MLPGRRRTQLS